MRIKVEKPQKANIINFYPEQIKLTDGDVYVANKGVLPCNDLYRNILEIAGVRRLLVAPEFISVKYECADIEELKMLIMAELDDYKETAAPLLQEPTVLPLREYAEALADALVRPTLNRDNGDIIIHGIVDDTIELSFTGHCAGCPYAQNTLQNVIMRTFMRYIPQIKTARLTENK